jgi:hypothetical protein
MRKSDENLLRERLFCGVCGVTCCLLPIAILVAMMDVRLPDTAWYIFGGLQMQMLYLSAGKRIDPKTVSTVLNRIVAQSTGDVR